MEVMSSTASVSTRTCFSHWSLNKSMLSWATLLLGLAARAKAALITCNYHKQPINPFLRRKRTKNTAAHMQIDYLSPFSPSSTIQNTVRLFKITIEIKPCLFWWKDRSKPQDEGRVIGAQIKKMSKQLSEGRLDVPQGHWWNAAYLRAQCFQLGSGHPHQLHSLFVVGDGACKVSYLQQKIMQLFMTW